MFSFKVASMAFASLCGALFVTLLVAPQAVFWLFGLEDHGSTQVLARRAAMLFAGLGLMAYKARHAEPSPLRRTLTLGWATALLGLALVGIYEFSVGAVGPGIWMAIVGETVFAALLLRVGSA